MLPQGDGFRLSKGCTQSPGEATSKVLCVWWIFHRVVNINPAEIVEANETGRQEGSPVVTSSSDEKEEIDVGEITYVGRARRSQGGMKMVMTVDEVLKQRKDGLSYS